MHLPDGIISDPAVLATGGALAAGGLALAWRRCRGTLSDRLVPFAGVMTAFLFALQMVNFPIGSGVSGHLVGGTLAAVALGPWLGALVVALVVIPQCLFFNDGGLLSLGINITAMALVGALSGGALAATLGRFLPHSAAWFLAAWASTVLAALTVGAAVVAGSDIAGGPFLKTLVGVHLLIGVGEGLITVMVLGALRRLRPDLLGGAAGRWGRRETALGLGLATLVVVALSPLASAAPDGLEASLERVGALTSAVERPNLPSPMNDYLLANVPSEVLAGVLAGLIGLFLCLALAHAALRPALPRSDDSPAP